MRKKQKKQSRLIKPAAMLGAFLCLLLGFTVIKAWPGKKQTDKQAWTASLLSVGLPVSTKPSLQPKAEDDDWPMPEQTQTPASTPKEDAAAAARPVKNMLSDARPAVMLYSTHSNESYRKTEETVYTEQPNSRTMNNEYNILKINYYLSSLLAEQHELPILFDATDHELGKYYTTAYARSLATVERAREEHKTLSVFLDIHRDSSGSGGIGDTVTVNGKPCAKIMFVIGTGEGKTESGFSVRPNWEQNKAFAESVQKEIDKIAPGLCRGVRVKTGRYNQHIPSKAAVAIEMGHNQNTLEEVMNSVPYLAQALATVLQRDLDI